MKCLKCGGMQMLRCEHIGGGIYWLCPRCNSTDESTSNSNEIVNNRAEDKFRDEYKPSEEFKKSHQHIRTSRAVLEGDRQWLKK